MAVLHGLGTGSDTPVRWVLALTVACVALIAALTGWRLAYGWPSHAVARLAGALALVLALIAGGAWLTAGPLQPGWARRAGTPPHLVSEQRQGELAARRGDRGGHGERDDGARRAAQADPAGRARCPSPTTSTGTARPATRASGTGPAS